ncbi:MAG: diguanylate cyclase, partial [Syntrophomonadaceae bacterium]|nr:diguanylate cyclase [Syntrophomonadaceae bacterium]
FLVILPNTKLKDAFFVSERIQTKLSENYVKCTISIGIAVYPNDGLTIEELISIADKGLYKSKALGRNTTSYEGNLTI